MEKLLACLKIYETKYPKEKLHGSFAHFFLSAHPVDSCCCKLPSKCYLQKVPVVLTRALRVFVGNGIVPLASPHASSCQTNFPQRVFTKSGGILYQWQWTEEKQLQKNISSEHPLTLLVWGRETRAWMFWWQARKFITAVEYCECNFLGVCCALKTAPSWFLLHMYWEKPTVLCHGTYFGISPSKNNIRWKDMNFVCAWKKT